MFPLTIRLIHCADQVRRDVLSLLANLRLEAAGEYASVDDLVAGRADVEPACLFVINLPAAANVADLRRLSTVFPGRPVLALLGATDPATLFAAMRNGATQVVPVPLVPDDFTAAMDSIARHYAPAVAAGGASSAVLVVSGVSGGCGASVLAVNLAHELVHETRRTAILAEPTVPMGTLASYVDVQPAYTTQDLYSGRDRLDADIVRSALAPVRDRLSLLAAEYRTLAPTAVPVEESLALTDLLRTLADVVVLDVPCTYDDLYFETLARADHVLLVGEQRIPSIRSLRLVSEALARVDGVRSLHVVINRYDARLQGFGAERLKELLGVTSLQTVANDGEAVHAAVNNGRPIRAESPRSPALSDIRRLLRSMLPMEDEAAPRKPPMLTRMIRAFGLKA